MTWLPDVLWWGGLLISITSGLGATSIFYYMLMQTDKVNIKHLGVVMMLIVICILGAFLETYGPTVLRALLNS